LFYSDNQNVSSDLKGKLAAVVIEGHDTHTRTGFIDLKPEMLRKMGLDTDNGVSIPVTHSTLFGWYDNEYGSYVHCLGRLAVYIDNALR
jgi:glyceraldehyde 3-phosphate dehydrogenase